MLAANLIIPLKTAWASNQKQDEKQSFGSNVTVQFNGLTTSGKVDVSVAGSSEFQSFKNSIQKICSCMGGDPKIAGLISSSPEKTGIYDDFKSWVDSASQNPAVMSFQTVPLWEIMAVASTPTTVKRAGEVEAAFKWICANPARHVRHPNYSTFER